MVGKIDGQMPDNDSTRSYENLLQEGKKASKGIFFISILISLILSGGGIKYALFFIQAL